MEPLKTGLAGLQQVSAQLRNLPNSHDWNFNEVGGPRGSVGGFNCGSHGCAAGLMRALWPEQCDPRIIGWKMVSTILGLPKEDIEPLFGMNIGFCTVMDDSLRYYGKKYCDVTATDVADAIDTYITKHQPVLPTLAIIITTPQRERRVRCY